VPEPAVESRLSQWYRAAEFFVVRSPLLPVERLLGWLGPGGADHEGTAFDFEAERARLARRLLDEFRDPALRDALFLASPEAHDALRELSDESPAPAKLERSLLRYFLRASGRETPFGLLAGHSLGRFGGVDCFELLGRDQYRTRTRISISFLLRLMTELSAQQEVMDHVPHEPNSSLSLVQGNYRIAIDEADAVRGRTFFSSTVAEVTRTPALDLALDLARAGRSPSEIAKRMAGTGLDYLELLDFCRSLSEAKILVPVWLPSATGSDTARLAIEQLAGHPALDPARLLLTDVVRTLDESESAGLGAQGPACRLARQRLLDAAPPLTAPQPLQTELVKPGPNLRMSEHLASRLLAAAELLQRIERPRTDPELVQFRNRFVARYDRRLVPLAEALDGDLGLGFGGTEAQVSEDLLSGIPFDRARSGSSIWESSDRLRLRLLEMALNRGTRQVELDGDLLDSLPQHDSLEPSCESFALVVRLARSDTGRTLLIVPELVAPSAISLLGRFCEADSELHTVVKHHADHEQRLAGETILADVAYCPSDDSANVVARPVLRHYEIPCGGRSGAPAEKQLPISDLLVGVEGDHVRLFSRRLGKRVAIRFASAHNHDQTQLPTLYRFLGAMQHQAGDTLVSSWSWGALEGSPFLPRVVSGDVVLSLARWQITEREWAPLLAASPQELLPRVRELRAARGLPRWLTRSELDRRLTVDLENQLSVEELVHEAQQRGQLALEELLPAHDQLVLRGPEGNYAGQFVVPFVRRAAVPGTPVPAELCDPSIRAHRRCRVPGSDWLYARIYAGSSRNAAILRTLMAEVVEPSLGSAAKLWFYLPFADPEPHLRIRFQGEPSELRSTVLSRLERALEPMLETGSVFRFELGSYEPEFERYGGPIGVELAERLFFADSDAASQLVALAGDDHDLRWQLALLGIDRLLSDCGAGLEERAAIAGNASEDYGVEMGVTTATWKAIGDKYRKHASLLSRWLWDPSASDDTLRKARRILDVRSARIAPIQADIERFIRIGRIRLPDGEALSQTFAHLHALRVLGVGGRAHELVLYEFLKRQYAARRSTKGTKRDLPLRTA
jgi:lantibiotic biosynthesis protein